MQAERSTLHIDSYGRLIYGLHIQVVGSQCDGPNRPCELLVTPPTHPALQSSAAELATANRAWNALLWCMAALLLAFAAYRHASPAATPSKSFTAAAPGGAANTSWLYE